MDVELMLSDTLEVRHSFRSIPYGLWEPTDPGL